MTSDLLGKYDTKTSGIEVSPALVTNTISDFKIEYKSNNG